MLKSVVKRHFSALVSAKVYLFPELRQKIRQKNVHGANGQFQFSRLNFGAGAGALDGAHLALEFERTLDVAQHDGARSGARDFDGAVVEDAPPQVLFHQDALDLADDYLVGVTVQPTVAVEESLIAHKDGGGQVLDEAPQLQIGPAREAGLVDDGLARGDNLAYFHIFT